MFNIDFTTEQKIKLTAEHFKYFVAYLSKSQTLAFSGPNNFKSVAAFRDREQLYNYLLLKFGQKCTVKMLRNRLSKAKRITIAVDVAEVKMLFDCIFKRVDCDPFTLAIIQDVTAQLKPINVEPTHQHLF